jgi:cell division cycle 20-like protein 1 (cofactor of APC complex)
MEKKNYQKALLNFNEHQTAMKVIAWFPHYQGRLCSGGETANRCIRLLNTLIRNLLHWVDTGSKVCNLIYF